jgi:DNA-binding MarR family transcriptional regulator
MIGIAVDRFDAYLIDVLMRDLVGHDRKPTSFLVYLWLSAEQARGTGHVQVSYQEMAESIGISKSSTQAAVRWLERRKLVTVSKDTTTSVPRYKVHRPWAQPSLKESANSQ